MTTTRRRVGTAVALLTAVVTLAACMNAEQQEAFDLVNAERAAASLPALAHDATAQAKAQAWADHLATTNSLSHSNLSDGMDDQWIRLAENVGYGASISSVHDQFMRSANHRSNVLSGSMTHLGAGVARAHGKTFVVLVFVQR